MCCWNRHKVLRDVINTEILGVPLNFNTLLDTFDNDTGFVCEVVDSFLKSFNEYYESLESSARSGDYKTILKVAHTLKGTSANVECYPLSSASADLENYVRQGVTSETDLTQNVEEVVVELVQELIDNKVKLVFYEMKRVEDTSMSNVMFSHYKKS